MTLNLIIQKRIKYYIDSGLTAAEMYRKLNKTVPNTSAYRWYANITRGKILAVKSVGQDSFPTRNGLTKMTNVIVKTTASTLNHEKQQTKTLAQDLCISFHSKSWYGLESPSMELPTSLFCPRKCHSMRTFTSKTFYQ